MLEPLCKMVACCVLLINANDTAKMQIGTLKNLQCETAAHEYPELIVNPE